MSSYSEEPRLREKSCRRASLWSPVPTETFNNNHCYHRRNPERDSGYRDIDEKYPAIERGTLDYSRLLSNTRLTVGKNGTTLRGENFIDRNTTRSSHGLLLDSFTSPGAFRTLERDTGHANTEFRQENALEDSISKAITLSIQESGCSEMVPNMEDLQEESDQETAKILQEIAIALKELSIRDQATSEPNGLPMKDILESTSDAESVIELVLEPVEKEVSSVDFPSMSLVGSTRGEFESHPILLKMFPEVLAQVPNPCRKQDTSRTKPPLSREYDNSSQAMHDSSVPRKTNAHGKPLRNSDPAGVPPKQVSRRPNAGDPIPPGSGTAMMVTIGNARLSIPEAFELACRIADVIVLEVYAAHGKNYVIPPLRRDQQNAHEVNSYADRRSRRLIADDPSTSSGQSKGNASSRQKVFHKSEELWDASGYSDIDTKTQPLENSQEGFRESSTTDLNEGSSLKLNAPAQETKKRAGKYALLTLSIIVLFAGGIYSIFGRNT